MKSGRIAAYMEMMHNVSNESVRVSLMYLTRSGTIIRVRKAWYQRRWEVV